MLIVVMLCHISFVVILNVSMLSVIMLNTVLLCVVALDVQPSIILARSMDSNTIKPNERF